MPKPGPVPAIRTPPSFDTALPSVDRAVVVHHARELLTPTFVRSVVAQVGRLTHQRKLPVPLVLLALLALLLHQLPSVVDLFDRLTTGRAPGLPLVECSLAALYARFEAVPHTYCYQVFLHVTRHLTRFSSAERAWVRRLAPWATGIYAFDDTTLDALLRKTAALKAHAKGSPPTLGGRLGALLDLTTGRFAELLYDSDSAANEKTHFRPLVERMPAGSLFVFDLGYFAYPTYDFFTERYCYFVTRLHSHMSFTVHAVLADTPHYRDRLVWPGKYKADRAAYPVRLVEVLVDGKWLSYVTNVWNPTMLTPVAIWALYAQRWTIEQAFFAIKRVLGLATLHFTHLNGVLCQVWLTLALHQVFQELRLALAVRLGTKEDEVSWVMLMRRVEWYTREAGETRSLRDWLLDEAAQLHLTKRGVRQRRRQALPQEVLEACAQVAWNPEQVMTCPRKPRQGDRTPPKAAGIVMVTQVS